MSNFISHWKVLLMSETMFRSGLPLMEAGTQNDREPVFSNGFLLVDDGLVKKAIKLDMIMEVRIEPVYADKDKK